MADMIDVNELISRFSAHARMARPVKWLASNAVASEGWFRVELVPVLLDLGIQEHCIVPSYNYPTATRNGRNGRADLAILSADKVSMNVVFELKHFVQYADANKIEKFPEQIKRLSNLVQQGHVSQGIVFTAFTSRGDSQYDNKLLSKFSENLSGWYVAGPIPLLREYPISIAVATTRK